jgi:hypothetical protein
MVASANLASTTPPLVSVTELLPTGTLFLVFPSIGFASNITAIFKYYQLVLSDYGKNAVTISMPT